MPSAVGDVVDGVGWCFFGGFGAQLGSRHRGCTAFEVQADAERLQDGKYERELQLSLAALKIENPLTADAERF